MRYSAAEKLEVIRLMDGSDIGVTRTLKELGIHKSTFYNWYEKYQLLEPEGLINQPASPKQVWNCIPIEERKKAVEIALEKSHYSARELPWYITDQYGYYISESSVYRILREYGLMTTRRTLCFQPVIPSKTIPAGLLKCGRQTSPILRSSAGAGITFYSA